MFHAVPWSAAGTFPSDHPLGPLKGAEGVRFLLFALQLNIFSTQFFFTFLQQLLAELALGGAS